MYWSFEHINFLFWLCGDTISFSHSVEQLFVTICWLCSYDVILFKACLAANSIVPDSIREEHKI